MPESTLLTLHAVREWVDDHVIGKGRPYADTAVIGALRDTKHNTFVALVRGSRTRPYQVTIHLSALHCASTQSMIQQAHCECPVGLDGKCKHVAAVLLAVVEDPARFLDVTERLQRLDTLSREEAVQLVRRLLTFAPELTPLLAIPLPGFVDGSLDPAWFRSRAREVVQSLRLHEDRAEEDVIEGLLPLVELATAYQEQGESQAYHAAIEGVATALRESSLNQQGLARAMVASKQASNWDTLVKRLELHEGDASREPPF